MNCNFVTGKIGNENKKFYLCTTHKQYETEDTYNENECRYQEKENQKYKYNLLTGEVTAI